MSHTTTPSLRELLERVADALQREGVAYAVIGALARSAWANPRATSDLDVQVAADAEQWAALLRALSREGLRLARSVPGEPVSSEPVPELALFRGAEGRRVDVLVAKTAFEHSALGRRVRAVVHGKHVYVVTPEDLIVYKLIAGRARDLADVIAVTQAVEASSRSLDWDYVEHWCGEWQVLDRLAEAREKARRGELPDG